MPHLLDKVFCARTITFKGCIRKSPLTFCLVATGSCASYTAISVLIFTHILHLNASFVS